MKIKIDFFRKNTIYIKIINKKNKMENKMVWMYKGEEFANKYDLVKKHNLSTCKFKAKIEDGEITKIK